MSDIALKWDPSLLAGDFELANDGLVTDEGLQTAMVLSLLTDRAAESGDVIPDDETDRRGWWADELANVAGDKIGSRLWLLKREKDTPDVIARAEAYVREALAWMLEDGVAEQIDVEVESVTRLAMAITVHRPKKDPTRFRFDRAWDAEESRT
jgi:phage gp46-like protein